MLFVVLPTAQDTHLDHPLNNPFKMLSVQLGKKKKVGPKLSDDDIKIAFLDKFQWLGSRGCCMNRLGGKDLNCDCLSIFKDNKTREATVHYVFNWAHKSQVICR